MAKEIRALRERSHEVLLQCEKIGPGFDELPLFAVKQLSTRLENAYEKVGDANIRLRGLLGDDDGENDTATFMAPIDALYQDLAFKVGERIEGLQPIAVPPTKHSELKRPFESVGEFNGTHADWPAFRDLFTALVIKPPYENLERFLLLKGACKGVAAGTIRGYPPEASSFEQAWEALAGIYEDKHAATQALIDRMVDMPLVRVESAMELRRVIDTITSTMRQMSSMGYKCED